MNKNLSAILFCDPQLNDKLPYLLIYYAYLYQHELIAQSKKNAYVIIIAQKNNKFSLNDFQEIMKNEKLLFNSAKPTLQILNSQVLQLIQLKFLENYEELIKYFCYLPFLENMPSAIFINNFQEFTGIFKKLNSRYEKIIDIFSCINQVQSFFPHQQIEGLINILFIDNLENLSFQQEFLQFYNIYNIYFDKILHFHMEQQQMPCISQVSKLKEEENLNQFKYLDSNLDIILQKFKSLMIKKQIKEEQQISKIMEFL